MVRVGGAELVAIKVARVVPHIGAVVGMLPYAQHMSLHPRQATPGGGDFERVDWHLIGATV